MPFNLWGSGNVGAQATALNNSAPLPRYDPSLVQPAGVVTVMAGGPNAGLGIHTPISQYRDVSAGSSAGGSPGSPSDYGPAQVAPAIPWNQEQWDAGTHGYDAQGNWTEWDTPTTPTIRYGSEGTEPTSVDTSDGSQSFGSQTGGKGGGDIAPGRPVVPSYIAAGYASPQEYAASRRTAFNADLASQQQPLMASFRRDYPTTDEGNNAFMAGGMARQIDPFTGILRRTNQRIGIGHVTGMDTTNPAIGAMLKRYEAEAQSGNSVGTGGPLVAPSQPQLTGPSNLPPQTNTSAQTTPFIPARIPARRWMQVNRFR